MQIWSGTRDFTFHTSPVTLEDISHCTSVLFSAPILDVISWWIIQDHPTRKDKHSGSFFIVNYSNFPSDFFLFRKLFPLTQSYAFCFFFRTQLNENVAGPHPSILLWYIKTLNYVICDYALIFGLNPWNCVALSVYANQPLSLPSHLSFVCFIFTHSKRVSLIDDNSQAEKWGEVLFTV